MDIFLPDGFQPDRARRRMSSPTRALRLRVEAGGVQYAVLRKWPTGFAVSAADADAVKGVVDLFDGRKHLRQCLISGRKDAGAEVFFTVKSATGVDYAAATSLEELT